MQLPTADGVIVFMGTPQQPPEDSPQGAHDCSFAKTARFDAILHNFTYYWLAARAREDRRSVTHARAATELK